MSEEPEQVFGITIRPALPSDSPRLAEIRTDWVSRRRGVVDPAHVVREEVDFLDRLTIPHGVDYFCLVAMSNDTVIGYVIGGGSRDLDKKAHGEIYEVAVDTTRLRRGVGRALLNDAIRNIEEAEFAGTLLSIEVDNEGLRRLAVASGMLDEAPSPKGDSFVRFERLRYPSR